MRERSSPDAGVRVKPLMTLPAINTDASKYGKEQISCTVQEMFEEADCGWFQIKRLEPSYCLSTIRRDWQSFNTRTIERSPVRRRPFLHTTTRWRLLNTAEEIFCIASPPLHHKL